MAKSGLSGSSEAMRILKELEPGLYKELGKQLRSELNPIIKPIESQINSQVSREVFTAMPGMFHQGRSSWNGARLTARVSVNPKDLITVTATGRSSAFGFDYAELAGIRRRPARRKSRTYTKNGRATSHAVNGQGDAFISKLNTEFGKPGRFAWIRVLRRKPEIENKVEQIADFFGVKLSRRLM